MYYLKKKFLWTLRSYSKRKTKKVYLWCIWIYILQKKFLIVYFFFKNILFTLYIYFFNGFVYITTVFPYFLFIIIVFLFFNCDCRPRWLSKKKDLYKCVCINISSHKHPNLFCFAAVVYKRLPTRYITFSTE